MKRLVATANSPDTEMACPSMPTVAPRSRAIGVRRLTGMNSAAMSRETHIAIEATAPQVFASAEDAFRSLERLVLSVHVVAGRKSIRFVCIKFSVEVGGAGAPAVGRPLRRRRSGPTLPCPTTRGLVVLERASSFAQFI